MRPLWLACLLLALAAPGHVLRPAHADDLSDAIEQLDAGNDALNAGRPEVAKERFEAALATRDDCLPARHGLGEALLAMGDEKAAVLAFRRTVRDAEAGLDIPIAWREVTDASRKRLEELDENRKALDEIIEEYVRDLVRLATKFRTRDPDLAARALDKALALRPEDERGLKLRQRMADEGTVRTEAFDGRQIEDWDGGRSDSWSVDDGAIVVKARDIATYIRTTDMLEGNFDIIVEARFVEEQGETPFFAIMGAWIDEAVHTRFGVINGDLVWYEHNGKDDRTSEYRAPARGLRKPVDISEWNTYELHFGDDKIRAVVNGQAVHEIARPEERGKGYVGLLAQHCQVEFRKVDIVQR